MENLSKSKPKRDYQMMKIRKNFAERVSWTIDTLVSVLFDLIDEDGLRINSNNKKNLLLVISFINSCNYKMIYRDSVKYSETKIFRDSLKYSETQ